MNGDAAEDYCLTCDEPLSWCLHGDGSGWRQANAYLFTPYGAPVSYGEQEIEADIAARDLNEPRLTPASIDAVIRREMYYVFPGTTTTVCCLVLANGYTVIGQSAAASPGNFSEDIGRKIARAEARDKIWALEGYLLRQGLHQADIIGGKAVP